MSVKAVAKGVQMSPRKVGVVVALVRGRSVEDALTILSHVPRRSAIPIRKAIESAKANADHNHGYKPGTLMITEIGVTPGPRIKRYRPASHGRALPFQKKSSHIRVVVDGEKREVKKPSTFKQGAGNDVNKKAKGAG
ncbi:50S ribosomal protein L22 [Candidatus Saccharibacteria bacterium CG_4_10_14_0_2_um_filter_52_9]|nr:MAG: 50S ribosomal protein L22 [Candidatus Saccharibacteria bacterium CG_4_10_14_0_2_um_filter_52_9]